MRIIKTILTVATNIADVIMFVASHRGVSSSGIPATPCPTRHSPAWLVACACHLCLAHLLMPARWLLRRPALVATTLLAVTVARSTPPSGQDAKDKKTSWTQPLRVATHSTLTLTTTPAHPLAAIAVPGQTTRRSLRPGQRLDPLSKYPSPHHHQCRPPLSSPVSSPLCSPVLPHPWLAIDRLPHHRSFFMHRSGRSHHEQLPWDIICSDRTGCNERLYVAIESTIIIHFMW
jgi:hypothetical protein